MAGRFVEVESSVPDDVADENSRPMLTVEQALQKLYTFADRSGIDTDKTNLAGHVHLDPFQNARDTSNRWARSHNARLKEQWLKDASVIYAIDPKEECNPIPLIAFKDNLTFNLVGIAEAFGPEQAPDVINRLIGYLTSPDPNEMRPPFARKTELAQQRAVGKDHDPKRGTGRYAAVDEVKPRNNGVRYKY